MIIILILMLAVASTHAADGCGGTTDGLQDSSLSASESTTLANNAATLSTNAALLNAENTMSGTVQLFGSEGQSNALRNTTGDHYNLAVVGPTNSTDPHAVGIFLHDQGALARALHIYAASNGTARHLFTVDMLATGGADFKMYNSNEVVTVEANADGATFVVTEAGGSGVSPDASADSFVVDNGGNNAGITIASAANGSVYFANLADGDKAGFMQYIGGSDQLRLGVLNKNNLTITTTTVTTTNLTVNGALDVNGGAAFDARPTVGTQEVAYVSQLGGGGGGGITTNDVVAQWPLLDYQVATNEAFETRIAANDLKVGYTQAAAEGDGFLINPATNVVGGLGIDVVKSGNTYTVSKTSGEIGTGAGTLFTKFNSTQYGTSPTVMPIDGLVNEAGVAWSGTGGIATNTSGHLVFTNATTGRYVISIGTSAGGNLGDAYYTVDTYKQLADDSGATRVSSCDPVDTAATVFTRWSSLVEITNLNEEIYFQVFAPADTTWNLSQVDGMILKVGELN